MSLPPRRHDSRRESLWAMGGFLALSLGFVLLMELQFPFWTDPEYSARRECLLDRVAESPNRPVLAVLGSSRTGTGFTPEELGPIADSNGDPVLVMNYSHLGSGPRMNLLQLQRLLWDGIEPKWLIVELLPGHLHHEASPFSAFSARDVGASLPYSNQPRLLAQTAKFRLQAMHEYRQAFLETVAPSFATKREVSILPYGGDNNWERRSGWTDESLHVLNNTIRQQYQERMGKLRIDPRLDAAQRDLIRLCRDRSIPIVLVIFPEADAFRSWYGDGVEETIQLYLSGLRAEFGVSIVDAREWMPEECFNDPHHLTTAGAKRFTARLEQDVIRPMAAGEVGGACQCRARSTAE